MLGPLLLGAGAVLGRWWPLGESTKAYHEAGSARPQPETAEVPVAPGALPSLAPIVQRIARGVVGVRTLLEPGAGDRMTGTGFVIHSTGLILTNQHVVAGNLMIVVEVPGCGRIEADVVGEDAITDLAVLRLREVPEGLTVLKLAASEQVQPGDWVMTVSNPFEFRHTIAVGIVSYVGRHLLETEAPVTNEFLQIAAPAYPGASGGPVVDMQGHVVGVTRRALTDGPGISFAVPSKVVKWVLDSMERNQGKVRRGYLGLGLVPLPQPRSESLSGSRSGGALIDAVEPGQAAERAGLRKGDVILAWNGRLLDNPSDLHDWITCSPPGTTAEIEFLRDGVRQPPLRVTLDEVKPPHGRQAIKD